MKLIQSALLGTLLLLPSLVLGHGAESAPEARHGGQALKVSHYNLELQVQGSTLNLYLNDDHNQPLDAAAAVVDLVVLANKKKTRLSLHPKAGNLLSGQGEFSSDAQMKVILYLQLPGAEKVSARFSPLQ